MKEDGEPDFTRMLAPEPAIYNRFPGLNMTLPEVVFAEAAKLTLRLGKTRMVRRNIQQFLTGSSY